MMGNQFRSCEKTRRYFVSRLARGYECSDMQSEWLVCSYRV